MITNLNKQLNNIPEKRWILMKSYMYSIKRQSLSSIDLDIIYGLRVDLEIYDFDENFDTKDLENLTIPHDIDIIKLIDCKATKEPLMLYKYNEPVKSSEVSNIIEGPLLV